MIFRELLALGKSLISTSIILIILSAIFYSSRTNLSNILGNYAYFALLIGVILAIIGGRREN